MFRDNIISVLNNYIISELFMKSLRGVWITACILCFKYNIYSDIYDNLLVDMYCLLFLFSQNRFFYHISLHCFVVVFQFFLNLYIHLY